MLRNNSFRGGLPCFGELVWARVLGKRRLELVWLGKTENSDEHLCGDEHGVRKFRTIRRQLETARWRREDVDKLVGEPFNPKPKISIAAGGATFGPPDVHATTIDQNVNHEEAPEEQDAASQKYWYVTEGLLGEHGRTMGCPRCSGGLGTHNAERRRRLEGILLQRQKRCTATSRCNDDEISGHGTGDAFAASNTAAKVAVGVRRPADAGSSSNNDAMREPSTNDDEMDTEELCTMPSKRAKTIMGLEICVLEAWMACLTRPWVELARILL